MTNEMRDALRQLMESADSVTIHRCDNGDNVTIERIDESGEKEGISLKDILIKNASVKVEEAKEKSKPSRHFSTGTEHASKNSTTKSAVDLKKQILKQLAESKPSLVIPYYKEFDKVSLGSSDIACLTMRGCSKDGELILQNLSFGGDGCYSAYYVKGEAEIGKHYEKAGEFHHWLEIFDDEAKTLTVRGDTILVYRAGDYGCIVQVL